MVRHDFLRLVGSCYPHKRRFSFYTVDRVRKKQTSTEYCMDLVRKHDFENYLCTLLLPKKIRRTGVAVRAFNIEVATIQDQVTDTKIGQMRCKFWENSLAQIYEDKVPKHPVLIELYVAAKSHKLSKMYLKRLITARESFMLSSSMKSIEHLETYAENVVSPINYLFLEAMDIKNVNADHAVSHLGKCQGIVNIIRSLPYANKIGRISMPQDILLKYNVSHENIIRQSNEQNVRDAIFEVASRANSHLTKACAIEKDLDKNVKSIFLPAVALGSYLEKLRKSDFNVFDSKLQQRNSLLPIKLLWRKLIR
ncbi:NADH dehydrogenase (ubiquinone) complex I, assembly factor 6 [Adelges cooleyi]|uniref:NADH dehydrogenase (ubiquinone) complex I, assembly factor 6 n=1 Tax=Adelges cooleyi TaxID=133065 RepID=UPI00217F941F|nr:NADH dehydrogenase (ubiquinone) complex I, assembly factor 6 [Adelges cooleyi]XP_050426157.1 NADH dehydrogenase (ubiquinone) complex I, assembly factor 6 [Adelges cooleyi]